MYKQLKVYKQLSVFIYYLKKNKNKSPNVVMKLYKQLKMSIFCLFVANQYSNEEKNVFLFFKPILFQLI